MADKDVQARRVEVARRWAAGESEREIARALGVSRTTVWTDKQVVSDRNTAMAAAHKA